MDKKIQKTTPLNQITYLSMKKPMQYIMRLLVLGIFSFFPLNFSNNYTTVEVKLRTYYLLLILAAACALFVFLYLLGQKQKIKIDFQQLFKSIRPYEYAILAYWVVLLISAICSPYSQNRWIGASERPEGFFIQSLYIITLLMVGRFYKPNMQDFVVLCLFAVIISIYGILQYYGLDLLSLNTSPEEYGRDLLLVATMSNRNIASVYFVIAFCVGYVLFTQKSKRWHWAFFPCALILFYMLLIGDTESGYLGLLFACGFSVALVIKDRYCAARLFLLLSGCVALMWIYGITYHMLPNSWIDGIPVATNVDKVLPVLPYVSLFFGMLAACFRYVKIKPRMLSGKAWRIGWPTALLLCIIAILAFMPVIARVTGVASLQEIADMMRGDIDDNFFSARIFVWRRAVTLLPNQPLFGYGPDMFVNAFKGFYAETREMYGFYFDKVHSEYLQVLIDAGVFGLVSLLALYFLAFWNARKKFIYPFVLAAGVAMLCFLVQASFNFSTPIAHPIVWTMWGIFLAAGNAVPEELSAL